GRNLSVRNRPRTPQYTHEGQPIFVQPIVHGMDAYKVSDPEKADAQRDRGDDRENAFDHDQPPERALQPPNGSRLSCGRPARRRKSGGRQSVPARAQHSVSLRAITARQLQALVRAITYLTHQPFQGSFTAWPRP